MRVNYTHLLALSLLHIYETNSSACVCIHMDECLSNNIETETLASVSHISKCMVVT